MIRDNRGTKLTIGRGGLLKVQHLVSVARPSAAHSHSHSHSHSHVDSRQPPGRIAYIEFYVKPEVEEEDNPTDS